MKKITVLLLLNLALSSCATTITPLASGGSRADGTLEYTYTYGILTRPQIDWDRVGFDALQRCSDWGYTTADMFPGAIRECASTTADGGCNAYRVTTTFQCGGSQ